MNTKVRSQVVESLAAILRLGRRRYTHKIFIAKPTRIYIRSVHIMVNAVILNAYGKLNDTTPLETDLIQQNVLQPTTARGYHQPLEFEDHAAPISTTRVRPGYRGPLETRESLGLS